MKEIISIEAAETTSGWHQVTYLVVGEAMPAQDMPMTWCHFDSSTPLFPRKIVTDSIQQWISFASSSFLAEWLHSLKVSPLQHIDLSSESCAACEASSCHLRCLHCERGTARPSRSIMGGKEKRSWLIGKPEWVVHLHPTLSGMRTNVRECNFTLLF